MNDLLICGIDIGSSKIATVVALQSQENKEIRIIGFNTTPSRGVKKGLIVDIDQVTKAVEESIEKAERMAGHQIKNSFVSVGGPHISSLNSHGVVAVTNPHVEIVEEDVRRVIEAARAISLSNTRQIIEVTPRQYSVDGQAGINNPVGMSGVRLEVDTHIITASSTNLKNIDKVLNDLGINNDGYIFSGLSSAEAVLTDTERDLGAAVVDFGGGKIDLCIFVEGALSYSASIPVGAKHITNDIAVGLRVSLESAEKIKLYLSSHAKSIQESLKKKSSEQFDLHKAGVTESIKDVTPKEVLDGIIGPRIEEMYTMIGEEINNSGYYKQIPAGLVITGGGALTIGMTEMGKKILGLPIRVGTPDKATGLVDEIIDPQYSSTLGLIFYGKSHIIESQERKDFDKILKNFSLNGVFGKIKDFVKQFLP
ncbi:cell division protein FtsA [Candidatus Roizmanbacteria bacterium RIFCSPHIGHO2_12_FULL_41_11]|uniref:Cell division protein FtsA n=1 Tax=Candidatus Roizmanbacteria bacterium RIFCSPHIGHO2_12_FULL_41_11 TaxID=1802052 RepID=A0A1F7I2K9_9BACT|nr:MAG: cell division protein FtsA [Candidatus Roizmanbacteria bacterium RIFCSPHIGHO2_12_FULL_41_11]